MFDNVEGIVRRQMVLFFCVDVSGSMSGEKIGTVNNTMREVLPDLKGIGGSDVDLKIAVLKFSHGAEWVTPKPVSVDEGFQWTALGADGPTALGATCKELAKKMSQTEFLNAPSASVAPAVFLLSDGSPTDDFEGGISTLNANKWFKYAIKVAIAIGDDADLDILAKFTGSKEAVILTHNAEQLRKWIKFVSVTSSQIGSKSTPTSNGQPESKQSVVINAIQQQAQEMQASGDAALAAPDDSWGGA